MEYSSLTDRQKSQVSYLFIDGVFGLDPNGFDYEIKDGNVIGRSSIAKDGDRRHARKPHKVQVNMMVREVPAEFVTPEMERNAAYAIQSIARRIVERMLENK